MSVSLDLGLFFRNSSTGLGLSLAARAVLYTLSFRVGSNATTWVSQEILAKECHIPRCKITNHIKALLKSGLIKLVKNRKDKRQRSYKIADVLINYYQMNDEQKQKVHTAFGDEYRPVTKQKKDKKSTGKTRDMLPKGNIYTLPKGNIVSDQKNATDPDTIGLQPDDKMPKGTYERDIKNKREIYSSPNLIKLPNDFYPDDQRRELLTVHARRTNNPETDLLKKFEDVAVRYKQRSADWQKSFEEFLIRELPKRIYEDQTGRKRRYDNQPLYN